MAVLALWSQQSYGGDGWVTGFDDLVNIFQPKLGWSLAKALILLILRSVSPQLFPVVTLLLSEGLVGLT